MSRIPIVIFAQVPPPEHGQSRMVAALIEDLRLADDRFEVRHVNARFSKTMDDIGDSSAGKLMLCLRYILAAWIACWQMNRPMLYYVPGPVKWSSVLRDWLLLIALRPWFRRVIFHWHAIGQGEWAHRSERLRLPGPKVIDNLARAVSRVILNEPDLSISLTKNSCRDAEAIRSKRIEIVPNGISDPWPDYESQVAPVRTARANELTEKEFKIFRVLFLSHGSFEKGIMDAIKAIDLLLESIEFNEHVEIRLTLAGGLHDSVRESVQERLTDLKSRHGSRFSLLLLGFVTGEEKLSCYLNNDVFLAPSHWESFGLTVAEAMASGLPVIAAASDGVVGVLPENYPYLSPIREPESLAAHLRAALTSSRNLTTQSSGNSLRSYFLKHYTRNVFSTGILGAISRQCDEKFERKPEPISVSVYLADQNPKLGRSLGISRMTEVVIRELTNRPSLRLRGLSSVSSIQMPIGSDSVVLPWNTRSLLARVLTDHLHPLWQIGNHTDIWYFPKGFLPKMDFLCSPSVVTIHDTIIQYYADHYPEWRTETEYLYWANMLKHTLQNADAILTVSESAKLQIQRFMKRHHIPEKEIIVTYEPCIYESISQPDNPAKADYVLHLGSREPHKSTAWLIRQWLDPAMGHLPELHVIGSIPEEVEEMARQNPRIVQLPFLDDGALRSQFTAARALIFPSEIEGFGLPAVEAYYLGTPVCFVNETSVAEVLSVATNKGGFDIKSPESLKAALDEVMGLSPDEVRYSGLKLRETYAAAIVADKMTAVFERVGRPQR